jgi:transposase-like protein
MNELKTRGVQTILVFCTDNLKGIDDAIKSCYSGVDHQKCIVHQIRNSVKHVSYKDLKKVCADLKAIYTASTAEIGMQNLVDFSEKWEKNTSISAEVVWKIGNNYQLFGNIQMRFEN